MAGLGSAPSVGSQIALVAQLRWRIFRNSLGTWKARLDLLALILVWGLAGVTAASIGLALGVGAYSLVRSGKLHLLVLPMWAVFGGWQLIPLLVVASGVQFDFRNLLRFPLRFPAFFLLSLTYGLLDPAGAMALLWLVSIATGIFFAGPEIFTWVVVVLAVYAAANLLLNRLILSWLDRLLARRRTREAFLVIFLTALVTLPLFLALGGLWGERAEPFLRRLVPLAQALPPGLAGKALADAAQGNATQAATCTALLAAYGLGFGLFLRRRLRAQYLGEDAGEAEAPVASPGGSPGFRTVQPGWQLPGFSEPVCAVFEKELRYLFRNGTMLLNLLLPLILVAFFALAWSAPERRPAFFAQATDFFFPSAVAYSLMILGPMAHNSFAYEGYGIQLLLASPVHFREVLLAKNLAHGAIILCEAGSIWLLLGVLGNPPGAMIVVATFSALMFLALLHFSAGNLLSLYFPRRFEMGLSRQRTGGVTILAGLVLQIVVLGCGGVIFFFARWLGGAWGGGMAVVIFLALTTVALRIYLSMLERCSRIAVHRQEILIAELCHG